MTGLIGGAVVGATTAAAGAIVGMGAAAFSASSQFDAATKKMQSQLDLNAQGAENFRQTLEKVYSNNFGDSIDDVADSITKVEQAFGRLGGAQGVGELQQATESAIALRDAFDVGVNESTEAAVELMDKFGLTSTQAFDFLARGYQKGLDSSGDFLDSVTEYSTQFSNGGADATQFFNLLQSGLQAGALGTDKAADAFKEFRVRIGDGSKTTAQGLEMLGINAEAFTNKLAAGTITSADAFQIVLDKLREIEDPTLRMQAGVALLGTQFEDLGDSAVANLSLARGSLDDFAGATDALNKQYDTLGSFFEGLWRRTLVAVTPLTDGLLSALNEMKPQIEDIFAGMETAFNAFVANSNFEWSPEFKQIKLGDLFEFVKADGVTKIIVGDWFEFTGFGTAKQIKLGDLFEFTTDSGGTTINLADYLTLEFDAEGAFKIELGDLFEIDTTEGKTTINLADYITVEYDSDTIYHVKVGSLFEFEQTEEKRTFNVLDVVTIETTPDGGPVSVDVSKLFTWDRSKVGTIYLSDFVPWIEGGPEEQPIIDLSKYFKLDVEQLSLDLGEVLADAATTISVAVGAPDWFVELQSYTWPELKEATSTTLNGLIAWAFPDPPSTIDDLLDWAWPDFGETLTGAWASIFRWVWPQFGADTLGTIADLLTFEWPELETPGWVSSFTNAVNALLGWTPPPINVPGGGGGGGGGGFGGDDTGGTSSGGTPAPSNDTRGRSASVSASSLLGTSNQPVVVNFYNTVVNNDADIEVLAARVAQRLAYA
ncbi:MAG: phage tail tape measure protein [Caldilineaceae bacterium]